MATSTGPSCRQGLVIVVARSTCRAPGRSESDPSRPWWLARPHWPRPHGAGRAVRLDAFDPRTRKLLRRSPPAVSAQLRTGIGVQCRPSWAAVVGWAVTLAVTVG